MASVGFSYGEYHFGYATRAKAVLRRSREKGDQDKTPEGLEISELGRWRRMYSKDVEDV